nr:hypothetical protein [uncultured Pedobacter sp.]
MKTLLKSASLIIALVLTNSLTFAAEKTPEIYVSESSLSNLSGSQLLHTGWFWILIIAAVIVFATALLCSKDQEDTYFPEHII